MKWSDLQIVRKLGEGAAGSVFAAINNDMRTKDEYPNVAVKRYKRWVLEQPGQMERILREREIGFSIDHPNLVKVIQLVFDDESVPALVMKHYEGMTLENHLSARGYDLSFDEIVKIVGGIAAAISALHQKQVVHRDVKPANVIMCDGDAVLMDLGVIKPDGFPEETNTGQFLGTIRYAAPDALFGQRYDHTVDIYGLGLVLEEMLQERRHLAECDQWASLIVEKKDEADMRMTRAAPLWTHLLERHKFTLSQIDFAFNIWSWMTEVQSKRLADLSQIASDLDARLWDRTFHIEKYLWYQRGSVCEGEPEFNLWSGSKEGTDGRISLHDAREILESKLDASQLSVIKNWIKRPDFVPHPYLYLGEISQSDFDYMRRELPQFFRGEMIDEIALFANPDIWFLWRYGYWD